HLVTLSSTGLAPDPQAQAQQQQRERSQQQNRSALVLAGRRQLRGRRGRLRIAGVDLDVVEVHMRLFRIDIGGDKADAALSIACVLEGVELLVVEVDGEVIALTVD